MAGGKCYLALRSLMPFLDTVSYPDIVFGTDLQFIKVSVFAAQFEQFCVRSSLDDFAAFEEEDFVGVHQRAETVGNDDGRPVRGNFLESGSDALLSRGVDRSGGVVENDYLWMQHDAAGDGQALPLAAR